MPNDFSLTKNIAFQRSGLLMLQGLSNCKKPPSISPLKQCVTRRVIRRFSFTVLFIFVTPFFAFAPQSQTSEAGPSGQSTRCSSVPDAGTIPNIQLGMNAAEKEIRKPNADWY